MDLLYAMLWRSRPDGPHAVSLPCLPGGVAASPSSAVPAANPPEAAPRRPTRRG